MRMNMRVRAVISLFGLLLLPCGYAAESTPAATATRQGMAAAEHAGHDHAAMGGMGRPMAWTGYPVLKTRMSGENRETTIVPQNIVASGIEAFSNNLQDAAGHRQLALGMAGARLDKPASGGFQWLAAREEQGDRVLTASTVHYLGERGAKNPTAMFMQQKHELEIIPQPYPREHSRYRAGEDWKFLVRFNGQPLAGQKIALETSNGSKAGLLSDAQGIVNLHLPDDFKAEEEASEAGRHSHGRRGADFVLATEHAECGKTYLTAFNSGYGPNAFDQRSLAMGLGFTLFGGLCAVPLLRQRRHAPKSGAAATENEEI